MDITFVCINVFKDCSINRNFSHSSHKKKKKTIAFTFRCILFINYYILSQKKIGNSSQKFCAQPSKIKAIMSRNNIAINFITTNDKEGKKKKQTNMSEISTF